MSSRIVDRTSCFWKQAESSAPVRGLILYDEACSGKQAMRTLRSVSQILDEQVSMDVRFWRLNLLADPELHEAAKLDAAEASMLVVSVRHARRIPRSDHSLLATFFRQARWSDAMVVALVNDPTIHPAALSHSLAGLREEARRAGLEFLGCSPGLPAGPERECATNHSFPGGCGTRFHRSVSNFRPHQFAREAPERPFQDRIQSTANPTNEFP